MKTVLYIARDHRASKMCIGKMGAVSTEKLKPYYDYTGAPEGWYAPIIGSLDLCAKTWTLLFRLLGIKPPRPGKQIKVTVTKAAECLVEEIK